MTNLPQKNVNSIQFGKEIVHVNHVLIPGSPILKEKSLEDCSFSVDPKCTVKLQNFGILRNFLGSFQKSSAIVESSSETLALCRKKSHTFGSEKVGRYTKCACPGLVHRPTNLKTHFARAEGSKALTLRDISHIASKI